MERIIHDFRFFGIDVLREAAYTARTTMPSSKIMNEDYNQGVNHALNCLQAVLQSKSEDTDFVIHIPKELRDEHGVSSKLLEFECEDLTDLL